ncbi:hypothetical protein [Pseudomonas fontis]|uniref:Lipoprotein n=1 Tax=Pseudomonas fontis TaxID=2942633 RepID=A0ABT5NUT2_9PSED|nr:hypothetical protein [Pseudomonas fontis]MDD0977160.1 hypothetical protein [Pseudomonas fontis]MDD0991935.1 hypothetical protein [Pseudomonas fontis]
MLLGACASKPRVPEAPPAVLSEAAWQQVDRDIVDASHGVVGSVQDYARRSMKVWRERVQQRTEEDFIPWFTGYWTQQWLTLKVAWYKINANQQGGEPTENRLALYVQEQYHDRVLSNVAKEINPDLIRERASELYVQLMKQQLQTIAQRYRAAPDQFALRLNRIPAISLGPPAARNASLYQLIRAEPFVQFPAYLALNEKIRKAAASAGAAPSDKGLSSVAKKASAKLEATLAPRGAASAIAAAVGKAAGLAISLASAGIGAMMHESERPEMVEQLRVILNVALNEEWQSLMENPLTGVMAGAYYLDSQVEESLVSGVLPPGHLQPAR